MPSKKSIKETVPLLNLGFSELLRDKRLFTLLLIQLSLLAGTALMVYKIVEPSFERMSFRLSRDSSPYFALVLFICSLFAINTALKKKKSRLYIAQLEAGENLKRKIKQKIRSPRENSFTITLLLLEFILVIVLAGAIDAYLTVKDTDAELSNYQEAFFLFLAKVVIFSAILFFVMWLYTYASSFDSIKFKGRDAIRLLANKKQIMQKKQK